MMFLKEVPLADRDAFRRLFHRDLIDFLATHRVQIVVRPRVEELVCGSLQGCVEDGLDRLDRGLARRGTADRARRRAAPLRLFLCLAHLPPSVNSKALRPCRTRGLSPAVPPAVRRPFRTLGPVGLGALSAALTGGARAGSPAAHGWYAGLRHDRPGFQPTGPPASRPGLSGVTDGGACPDPRVGYSEAKYRRRSTQVVWVGVWVDVVGDTGTRTSDLLHVKPSGLSAVLGAREARTRSHQSYGQGITALWWRLSG